MRWTWGGAQQREERNYTTRESALGRDMSVRCLRLTSSGFMAHCLVFMPCFDPAFDTFESYVTLSCEFCDLPLSRVLLTATSAHAHDSMRSRSPFCVTTLIYVASKLEDPANTPSDLQKLCQEHAENIGMSTLFSPISTLEVVQAMGEWGFAPCCVALTGTVVALSSWGDTSWRPGGHAVRMAMDMGLYRCLPSLVQTGMGQGKSSGDLEEDRLLVNGARCWLTVRHSAILCLVLVDQANEPRQLCKMEFEMAFNLGRPALFGGEESIRHAREFLKHPLSLINDSRLVAACELLAKRCPYPLSRSLTY
jgi:hypothetical protein